MWGCSTRVWNVLVPAVGAIIKEPLFAFEFRVTCFLSNSKGLLIFSDADNRAFSDAVCRWLYSNNHNIHTHKNHDNESCVSSVMDRKTIADKRKHKSVLPLFKILLCSEEYTCTITRHVLGYVNFISSHFLEIENRNRNACVMDIQKIYNTVQQSVLKFDKVLTKSVIWIHLIYSYVSTCGCGYTFNIQDIEKLTKHIWGRCVQMTPARQRERQLCWC